MIETLISSRTRVKLLLKFFLNSNTTAYLRSLESEFGDSTNAIRLELNRLEEAGMLSSFLEGNKKMFRANTRHPLFKEVHNILLKTLGLDQIIETVIERLGEVEKVYLIGEFAKGLDSPIIDLVFLGNIDKNYLLSLSERAEELIKRKIRYVTYQTNEFERLQLAGHHPEALLLWSAD
ncbi:MAG: ArsR family transcriptional regulator [Bacteroidota bacterium]